MGELQQQCHRQTPKLSAGVYNTAYLLREPNELFAQNLDQLYAKNYGVLMDIRAVTKG